MTQRLPPQPGEWIDRSRRLGFAFEGRSYTGFAGDTITSALLANGVRLLGRSFKYHRARGVYSLANHDVNALMEEHSGAGGTPAPEERQAGCLHHKRQAGRLHHEPTRAH